MGRKAQHYLTSQQVALMAGVSTSSITKARLAVDPLHREAGGYDPVTVGQWLMRRALAMAGKTGGDVLDLSYEQALLARERRRALERDAEIKAGAYLLTADVIKSQTRAGMAIRDAMLSVPGRVAATLAGMDDERRIDRYLTDELRAELTRLADTVPRRD
jgi:phage terminase Nu1 subunit (DNA packaging protein)